MAHQAEARAWCCLRADLLHEGTQPLGAEASGAASGRRHVEPCGWLIAEPGDDRRVRRFRPQRERHAVGALVRMRRIIEGGQVIANSRHDDGHVPRGGRIAKCYHDKARASAG